MKIELKKDTACFFDICQLAFYPQLPKKPTIPQGTILDVQNIVGNRFGEFYCYDSIDGTYFIPCENAVIVTDLYLAIKQFTEAVGQCAIVPVLKRFNKAVNSIFKIRQ